jgi:hypothetical protein
MMTPTRQRSRTQRAASPRAEFASSGIYKSLRAPHAPAH